MISLDADDHRFNLRAAAVILNGSQVLLHRLEGDAFWSFPGGRVDGGELASSAVVREMAEEIGESVVCGELLWVVENFFTYRGAGHHELGLYFRVTLPPGSRLLNTPGPYIGVEGDAQLTFAWFEREALGGIDVRPSFVPEALAGPDLGFRHIVHRDEDAA
jgi:8-oxo-dGTP pyrophosphatase MutT (NUDIX family)